MKWGERNGGKGPSTREIGRTLGLYKGTVNDYVHRIESDPLSSCKSLQTKGQGNHVRLLYNRIYAVLRNREFLSLDELNEAIGDLP